MSGTADAPSPVDPRGWDATLVVGDLTLVALVLFAGTYRHVPRPLANAGEFVLAAAPFVVAWVLAAALLGTVRASSVATPGRAARLAAGTWFAAELLGLLVRQGVVGESAVWPFPLVLAVAATPVVVGWRVGLSLWRRRS